MKIGLVGCGRWGRLILRDLTSLGADVSVVARNEASRAAGASVVVDSIAALPKVDGFVVATPTSTHADVIEALPAGVPIFCEKPLCDDADRARRLAAMAGDRLFVMDKWRYHEGVLALAAIARSGELGPVVGLRTTRIGWGHDYQDVDCVWTLLPHELTIAHEILGILPQPSIACADRGASGVMGLIAMSGAPAGPWHVAEVSVRSTERRRVIALLCRDGMARLNDAYADHVELLPAPPANGKAPEPQPIKRSIGTSMPLLTELKAFIDYLRGGAPPRSSAAEAAAAVQTIAAIRRLAGI
jgi:predicted dehydrogenase